VGLPRVVLVGAVAACLAACGGSTSTPTRPAGASPASSTVTTVASCPFETDPTSPFSWSTLDNADSGETHSLSLCQGVGVELLAPDGCSWNGLQMTDANVMALVPLPLPAPPPGGIYDVYGAISTGQTTLTSTLSCPDASAAQTWAVSVVVTG